MMDANNAICSGVEDNLRAVAAGMISSEVMIRAPTNFIPTAITTPTISIKTRRIKSVFTPSTAASSSLTVLDNNGRQNMYKHALTAIRRHK